MSILDTANAIDRERMRPVEHPKPHHLDPEKYLVNPDFSVVRNVPRRYWKIENEQLAEMTAGEKAVVDAPIIATTRQGIMDRIDAKTEELIRAGFSYGDRTFSLSAVAQLNWTRLKLRQASEDLSYPVSVSTIDNGRYSIADEQSMSDFFAAMDTTIESRMEGGRAQKDAVNTLSTVAELESWADSRE